MADDQLDLDGVGTVQAESGADGEGGGELSGANLDLLMDVDMKLTVELGRARLKFRDVLNLSAGSVVELAKLTSEPVDIMVNGALLASGEVVVVDDHFAVRITKLLNRVERLKRVL
ncbi:flagellar motor switch protein FliN [bacterium]|nr:flagellar motor switch protein FliN [bacterium]